MKILLVDDTEDNRFLIKAFLRGEKIEFIEAANGEEAYTLFVEHEGKFDLLLIDLHMPILDGPGALKKIHSYEVSKGFTHIPSAAITADTHSGALVASQGFSEYLPKPISKSAVHELINRYRPRDS